VRNHLRRRVHRLQHRRGPGPAGRGHCLRDWMGTNDFKWRNIAKRRLIDITTPEATAAFLDANRDEIRGVFHMAAISTTTETDVDAIVRNNIRASPSIFGSGARARKFRWSTHPLQRLTAMAARAFSTFWTPTIWLGCGLSTPMGGARPCLTDGSSVRSRAALPARHVERALVLQRLWSKRIPQGWQTLGRRSVTRANP